MDSDHPDLLSALPPELLFEICLRFLQPQDVLRLSQVARKLNRGICRDERLWKFFYHWDLSRICLPQDGSYRQAYAQAHRQIQQRVEEEKDPDFRKRLPVMEAIKHGYEQLVDTMINQDSESADFWIDREFALHIASIYGHRHIMERLLHRTAQNHDSTMWPTLDYDSPMHMAAHHGHRDIVEWMLQLGATEYDDAMAGAASGGHRDIMERMIERGATDYSVSFVCAAKKGQRAIVEWLLELGTGPHRRWVPTQNDYDRAINWATENHQSEIIDIIRQHQENQN